MSKSTTRLVRECPEDFIGQIIDIFEDDLTNAASDRDDGSSCLLYTSDAADD